MDEKVKKHKKTAVIAMVKDEADIIELFIRYHMQFINMMVILDNCSCDNTVEIIRALQKENMNVHLLQDKDREYRQAEKTARLTDYTLDKFAPDIIIPLDADEFLEFDVGLEKVRDYFDNMRDDAVYVYESYSCRTRDFAPDSLTDNMSYYYNAENVLRKVMVTSAFWHNRQICFSEGNHDICRAVKGVYFPYSQLKPWYNSTEQARLNFIRNNAGVPKDLLKLNRENISAALEGVSEVQYEIKGPLKLLHFDYRSLNQGRSKALLQTLNLTARLDGIVTGTGYKDTYLSLRQYNSDDSWLEACLNAGTYKA